MSCTEHPRYDLDCEPCLYAFVSELSGKTEDAIAQTVTLGARATVEAAERRYRAKYTDVPAWVMLVAAKIHERAMHLWADKARALLAPHDNGAGA